VRKSLLSTGAAVSNNYAYRYTQVVSDVDDTLKSSGGVNVAGVALGGIDVQYSRGELYPGVAEFMLYLSLGTAKVIEKKKRYNSSVTTAASISQGAAEKVVPAKVAILTARAEEFKVALQLKTNSALALDFQRAGEVSAGVEDWVGR
jgi:hypothetical protein